jgi:hypothetical protein
LAASVIGFCQTFSHSFSRQTVLEDRWMPKSAYFTDGRYQNLVADPWNEKVDQAVLHAAAQ